MSSLLVVVLLSMLLGIQPVTTDLYLPALPAITRELDIPVSQTHLTLSALLLAFGVSQLAWGPLSDRWGRRPILLWGLGIYTLSGIGCVLAASMAQLIFWRTLQGAAMGAVVMCGRAMVRDLYVPEQGARVMSKALTGLGFIACVSAPLGGLLSDLWHWRVALMVLVTFGVLCFAMVALRYQETSPRKNRHALHPRILVNNWWHIVRHPVFIAFTMVTVGTYGALFCFLTGSSFVFIEKLGLARWQYGMLLFSMAFVYLIGTFLCRRLLHRMGVHRTVAIGGLFSVLGGGLMMLFAWLGWQTTPGLIGPLYLFMLGHGIHQPCGQSGAIGPFPHTAGTASALGGFLMMVAAFITGLWLGAHADGTVFPMVHGVAFWSIITALSAWCLVFPRRVAHD